MGGFHLYFSPAPTRVLDLSNTASLNLPSLDWESHGPLSFYSCASEAWVLRDGRAEKRGVGWGCVRFLRWTCWEPSKLPLSPTSFSELSWLPWFTAYQVTSKRPQRAIMRMIIERGLA